MFFPRKKWEWVVAEEYAPQQVIGVAQRNRNGSDRQSILRGCKPGMRVTFRHDPDQPTDPTAIAVLVAGGQQIGNLYAGIASEIGPLLGADEEVRFPATIASVGPYEDAEGRRLLGAELKIVREEYRCIEKFWLFGAVYRGVVKSVPVVGRLASLVDKGLVSLTKSDPFLLGLARFVAGFLVVFSVFVVLHSLYRTIVALF